MFINVSLRFNLTHHWNPNKLLICFCIYFICKFFFTPRIYNVVFDDDGYDDDDYSYVIVSIVAVRFVFYFSNRSKSRIEKYRHMCMCGRWFSVIYLYYWFLLLSLFKIIEYPGVEYITNISEPIVLLLILRWWC